MTNSVPSPTPARTRSTKVSALESDTRDAIVRAALELFSKHGIDGVSLRQIVTAAGQSNPSAVHYHFQNKDGLVEAVVNRVIESLTPLQEQALASIAEADQQGRLTVREVVRVSAMPLILLYSSGREGRLAIRFLSRLMWQPHHVGQARLTEFGWQHLLKLVNILQALLPQREPEALQFLVVMFFTNLIHGLADISLLGRQQNLGMTQLYVHRSFDMIDWYIDYVAAGMSGVSKDTRVLHEPGAPYAA